MLWLTMMRLKSGDPEKRRQAVEDLADEESSRALDGLSEAMQDTEPQVRVAAVIVLTGIRHERAAELLLRAINDPAPAVRHAALSRLKDDGSARLKNAAADALRDSDAGVRGRAARFLLQCGWTPRDLDDEIWLAIAQGQMLRAAGLGSAAIQPLESVLQAGGYSHQAAVVEALGSIPDERVLKALLRALRSSDHVVCMAAIGALTHAAGVGVVDDLAKLFKHPDHHIRTAAVESVTKLGPQEHGNSFRDLLRDEMWDVRAAAAAALGRIREPANVDALIAMLKDGSSDVRNAAAAALGRLTDSRAIGPLVLALTDVDTEVRKSAAGALNQISPKWADSEAARRQSAEVRSALGSGDWSIRRAASGILEQLGEPTSAVSLQANNEISSPARRRRQAVLTAFTELLKDADGDLRLAAALTLGRLRDANARSPLMTALSDSDQAVRNAAARALAELGV